MGALAGLLPVLGSSAIATMGSAAMTQMAMASAEATFKTMEKGANAVNQLSQQN